MSKMYDKQNPFKFKEPVWNGGKPYVTLKCDKVSGNGIHFIITYKDAYGNRKWPDLFYLSPERAEEMPIVNERWGKCYKLELP